MASDHVAGSMATACAVQEGDTVIWAVNREKQSFLLVKSGGSVRLGNAQCRLDPIIGTPYGSVFTVADDGKTLQHVLRSDVGEWAVVEATERNNAELLDDGANQTLAQADINRMKQAGATGEEILAALEASSSTFASKTEFSQEKYRRKKARKYLAYATVIRPTARSICEAYFSKTPAKICNLRVDTLAVMLSQADVQAHARVLVLETCGGLVMGAVAERLGGFGTACSVYTGRSPPSQDAVRMFNFPWAMRDSLCCASLERLAAAASGDSHSTLRQGAARTVAAPSTASDDARTARTLPPQIGPAVAAADLEAMRNPAVGVSGDPNQAAASANGVHHAPEVIGNGMPVVASAASSRQTANSADILPSGADGAADPGMDVFPPSNDDVAQQPEPVASVSAQNNGVSEAGRFPRNAEPKRCITTVPPASDEQLRALLRPGFSSCVIAAPTLQPIAAVQRLLPFLAPSAFLVVFSPFLQPLAEAMAALQASKAAINLQLQESWWRESQVLPFRTHPEMATTGTGGYLLSGIKLHVQPPDIKATTGQSEAVGGAAAAKPPANYPVTELTQDPPVADVLEAAAKKAKKEGLISQRPTAFEQPNVLSCAISMDDTAQLSEHAA